MPLTRKVTLKAVLEKGNKLQIPKLYRQQYKMETDQLLRVSVNVEGAWPRRQDYLAKMDKQGRILIPKKTMYIMAREQNPNLAGQIFDIALEPAEVQHEHV